MLLLPWRDSAQGAAIPHTGQHIRHSAVVPGTGTEDFEGCPNTGGEYNADNLHAGDVRTTSSGTDKFVGKYQGQLGRVPANHVCQYLRGYGHSRMDHTMDYPQKEKQKKTGERRQLIWKR